MPDPVTTNRGLAIPTHGSDVNTWDVPLNANFASLDTIVGGMSFISTTGGATVLNAAQAACGTIVVSGALASNAVISFPYPVQGWWSVKNLCSGTSSFNVVVGAGPGTEVISIPPGCLADIQINGGVAEFRSLPMVGSYLDVAATTVPLWIQGCTKPPYLNCDGSSFSSGTYPYLASYLSSTTLPDFRGRAPYYMNAGTSRLTPAGAGIDGGTLFASGGANGITLNANQIPSLTSVNASQNISVTSTTPLTATGTIQSGTVTGGADKLFRNDGQNQAIASAGVNSISVTYTNASQQVIGNAAPGVMSGIRLIRAG